MASEFGETATAVEEVMIGAGETVAEVASDPLGTVRKRVRSFEKKGAPVARRFNRRINALMPEQIKILGVDVNGRLPESIALKGIHLVKVQAKREDMVGDVAKRTLRVFNKSFKTIARTATRFEHASELAPRPATGTATTRTRRPRRRTVRRRAA